MSDLPPDLASLTLDPSVDPTTLSARQLDHLRAWASSVHQSLTRDSLYATLYAYFGAYGSRPFLGTRSTLASGAWADAYAYETYSDAWIAAQSFGSGLIALADASILPSPDPAAASGLVQTFVGISSINRREWVLADLACSLYGLVSVPLHATLAADSMEYIMAHADVRILVISADVLPKAIPVLPPSLALLVVMDSLDDVDDASLAALMATSIVVVSFADVVAAGAAAYTPHSTDLPPSAIHTIIYTSGSTGRPKGAVMTHARWNKFISTRYSMPFPTIRISFSPFAHVAERQTLYITLAFGGSLAFYTGSMDRIFDELAIIRPTMFASVPRFFNLIFSKFQAALAAALAAAHPSANPLQVEADVVASFSSVLGGRTQYVVTGSAPTSEDVKTFLRRAFTCPVYDGFGSTEVGGISVDNRISPNVDVKLVDVPHLGYFTTDKPFPRGEILVRTPHMIDGYYKNDEANASSFTPDGYFRTGDVGVIEADGCVRIIGRAKNTFKLANAEFVEPEGVENAFLASPLIDQIFVYGDPSRTFLVAVVVPNPAHATVAAAPHDAALAPVLVDELRALAATAHLPAYLVPVAVHVERTPFTPDNNLMTFSNKLSRSALSAHYAAVIDDLYAAVGDSSAPASRDSLAALLTAAGVDAASGAAIDSMSAVRLSALVKTQLGADVDPASLLTAAPSVDGLASALAASSSSSAASLAALHAQVAADMDVLPPAFCVHPDNIGSTLWFEAPRKWLVTGATGLIASHTLVDLVNAAAPASSFVCLVRAPSDAAAMDRLTAVLAANGVPPEWPGWPALSAVAGDLASPACGLDPSVWADLAATVDVVLHAGAVVNWLKPYADVRAANVCGTHAILDLCAGGDHPTFAVYLSTIGVAGYRESESQPLDRMLSSSGYSLSKYVGEQLFVAAFARGLPGIVVRPGMVTGSRATGVSNPSDFVTRLMAGILTLASYPEVDDVLDMTPVDFVASTLTTLALGGAVDAGRIASVFHLTNVANSPTYRQLGAALAAAAPTRSIVSRPYAEWRLGLDASDHTAALRPFFPKTFTMKYVVLDVSNTDAVLHPTPWPVVAGDALLPYAATLCAWVESNILHATDDD